MTYGAAELCSLVHHLSVGGCEAADALQDDLANGPLREHAPCGCPGMGGTGQGEAA